MFVFTIQLFLLLVVFLFVAECYPCARTMLPCLLPHPRAQTFFVHITHNARGARNPHARAGECTVYYHGRYTLARNSLPQVLRTDTPEKDIFKILNWAMRLCAKGDTPSHIIEAMQKAWQPLVATLQAGLMKLPQKPMMLFRAISGDWKAVKDKYVPGGKVRFSAFTSTSTSAAECVHVGTLYSRQSRQNR